MSQRVTQTDDRQRTYRSSTSHRPKQAVVDLNHLFDRLTCNPVARGGSGVCGNDDTALKPER